MSTTPGACRILLVGDFGGARHRSAPNGEPRKPWKSIRVDRDDLEEHLGKLEAGVDLTLGDQSRTYSIRPREFEDLEPDALFESQGVFEELRTLRRQLMDPHQFRAAAERITGGAAQRAEPVPTPTPPRASEGQPSLGLLDAAMEATEAQPSDAASTGSPLVDALIAEVIAPHVLPAPDPKRDELVASVDSAIAHQMRGLLHHPKMRAFETAWRGADLLVRRLETDSTLQVHLLDVGDEELRRDVLDVPEGQRSQLDKLLVEDTLETPGGEPWSLCIDLTPRRKTVEDLALLDALGRLAKGAGAPWIAAVGADFVGSPEAFGPGSDVDDWRMDEGSPEHEAFLALRSSPHAPWVALIAPGFLVRRPYGPKGSPSERFEFDECVDDPTRLPWTPASLLCAATLGEAFTAEGWSLSTSDVRALSSMPFALIEVDGETEAWPPAEILLTESMADAFAAQGLTCLRAARGSDALTLGPIRSIATDGGVLQGAWS